MVTLLQAIREELVPVVIVISLLALYAVMILTRADAPDDLRQLVGIVVAFYFAKGATSAAAREVRTTAATTAAAAVAAAATNGNGGH